MRIVRILTRPNVGGPTRQVAALWHAHHALGLRTLLVVGRCDAGEPPLDLHALGVPPAGEDGGLLVIPELQRALRPLRDRRAAHAIQRCIAQFRPDVVHTHTSKAGLLGRRAARRARVPVVAHTFHGLVLRGYYPPPVSALLRWIERRLARRTDLLFAISPSCRDELVQMRIAPAARIEVTPPAVELRPFAATSRTQARAALGAQDAEFLLGFVGRLVPIKRPDRFRALVDALPDVQAVVFGDGPLATDVEGPRLRRLGARADLAALLAGIDALAITSEREGCPLAALEAFAARVPVVGFDVPGVRDALAEWGAGLLVPPEAGIAGLAAAVARLRAAPELRAELIVRAAAGIDRFAPGAVAAQLAAAYERCLSQRAQRR